jgi:hypothetical protein
MIDASVKIAKLWQSLNEIKTSLDNEIIPLCVHLKAVDDDMLWAMQNLSDELANHFKKFHLVIQPNRKKE